VDIGNSAQKIDSFGFNSVGVLENLKPLLVTLELNNTDVLENMECRKLDASASGWLQSLELAYLNKQ
jgi:hypothetical protein